MYGSKCSNKNCSDAKHLLNHFPKTHRSFLRKITIDLLYFETFMTSIYERKISAEVRLIHAEQISYIISSF